MASVRYVMASVRYVIPSATRDLHLQKIVQYAGDPSRKNTRSGWRAAVSTAIKLRKITFKYNALLSLHNAVVPRNDAHLIVVPMFNLLYLNNYFLPSLNGSGAGQETILHKIVQYAGDLSRKNTRSGWRAAIMSIEKNKLSITCGFTYLLYIFLLAI